MNEVNTLVFEETPHEETKIRTHAVREIELKLRLKDEKAIEIVEKIQAEERDETIEKYIIIGEMVISHASICTTKETVDNFFSPLRSDIEMIRTQISRIVPTMAIPAKKAQVTQEMIFNSLRAHFMDDVFEDVSGMSKFADILATMSDTKIPVLIELKDYSGIIPSDEIKKFWRDLERRDSRYGIFVSMRSGITKCSSCLCLKTEMNKTAVFVNNSELNWSGHLFAYYVIKKIAEIESIQKKELKGTEISRVITKVNKHILELQKNVESIDSIQNIADSLRTTCKSKLDDLINLSNTLKRAMNEKITEIFEDLKKVEI